MKDLPEHLNWRPVLESWNQIHGAEFKIRECDLIWNFKEQDWVKYRVEKIAGTPVIYGVATSAGIQAGLSRISIWLALWGEISPQSEGDFINELKKITLREEKTRIAIGGDEFHFVSGVPLTHLENDPGQRFKAVLLKENFEGTDVVDFIGDVGGEKINSYASDALRTARQDGWKLHPVLHPKVHGQNSSNASIELLDFLEKEFPGRWVREFNFWCSRSDVLRATWSSLRRRSGEIQGFARLAIRDRLRPINSGWSPTSLKLPLILNPFDKRVKSELPNNSESEFNQIWFDFDSCLGPIGIAASQRGQGTGRVLLGLVLDELKRSHAKQICIDWTNAFKYYEPLGLEVSRRFWTASKKLEK